MRDNKAFASLTSGLLARKGQARPAMRPQGFGLGQGNPDDLGWNDMGHDVPRIAGAKLPANLSGPQAILPAHAEPPAVVRQQDDIAREFAAPEAVAQPAVAEPVAEEAVADESVAVAEPVVIEVALPEAVIEAPVIVEHVEPAPVAASRSKVVKLAPRVRAAPAPRAAGRKAAFTLRLDAERHLRLRLACAVQNRSAQMLVTDALDRLLASLPDVERLAASLPDADRHD